MHYCAFVCLVINCTEALFYFTILRWSISSQSYGTLRFVQRDTIKTEPPFLITWSSKKNCVSRYYNVNFGWGFRGRLCRDHWVEPMTKSCFRLGAYLYMLEPYIKHWIPNQPVVNQWFCIQGKRVRKYNRIMFFSLWGEVPPLKHVWTFRCKAPMPWE